MTLNSSQPIQIEVVSGNALTFKADVLALKYACAFHGVDGAAFTAFGKAGVDIRPRMPVVGAVHVVNAHGIMGAHHVLFAGVVPLRQFGYAEIREFGKQVIGALAKELPDVRHLALTLHGAGYGLDEIEAFESELNGLRDALESGVNLPQLQRITFVERNAGRAERLQRTLRHIMPEGLLLAGGADDKPALSESSPEKTALATIPTEKKPHIFVAMPFLEEMDDVYHYGIQNVVREAGFICERVDASCYTGDIVARVKELIQGATVVVADLSYSNPNVYLEVGYAWGCNKPTILLVNNLEELKFDVKGQKCLIYRKIKDLEQSLAKELGELSAK